MDIMFNRAALLSIQLYAMGQVFAGIVLNENRSKEVSRGDSVILTCNISTTNVTQINWSKDSFLFAYSFADNRTFSNFTSHTLIDITLPSKLNISKVQHDDAGLYRCHLTDLNGAGYILSASTGIVLNENRSKEVSRGDSVILTCNISTTNVTQLNWSKDSFLFAYSFADNLTFSNFTSHTLIDITLPSKLNISKVQHDDAGLYRCHLTDLNGAGYIVWNVTVYGEPEEVDPSWFYPYTLSAVIGLLLCVFTSAICLYRESWTNTSTQESNILSHVQFCLQLGGESLQVCPPPLHSCAVYRANHEQRESVQKLQIQFKAE
ncbi:hypothetical protein F7725_002009 [Dissostichus mawsoni]|uniref:Ig-like domain-containing protein n=1 Tax=Dissostichus mawsoni TaxID=36200 RepID=A0A7J5Y1F1_DISMA|nr:hypothetical protein F7725_002009 [Dissostichus mawsoni]